MKKNKKILIVGAGLEQILAIREATKLGLKVAACDGNPSAPGFKEAEESHVLDIRNPEKLASLARRLQVDGIFCHAVEIPDVISHVAAELGLPGLNPSAAETATNKILRIRKLKEHEIPCAAFETVLSPAELFQKAERLGFPLVLKPVDSAGARGVRVVRSAVELEGAYQEAISYAHTKEILLEEVLSGPEISTESVVYNGEIKTFAFADRNYARSSFFFPYFIEDGINFPSELPDEIQTAVRQLVEKTINALGIDFGAAKGDIIFDRGVPKVIEMAARTSGGWFGAGSILIATGSNMLKPLIQMAVGDEPDLGALSSSRRLGCAQRYVIPREEGVVESVTGVEDAVSSPGVKLYNMFLPPLGARIRKATNHAERYGHIICTGRTREEAMELCETAISKIRINVRK
jgi:biotin carboxylase